MRVILKINKALKMVCDVIYIFKNVFIFILLFTIISFASDLKWQVISGGGTEASDGTYFVSGTVSQTAIGVSTDGTNITNHGYWQYFCDCIPGNANDDATINLLDITYIIAYLYNEGPPPYPYQTCSADPNCDCSVNILDVTYLISYLYQNGSAPCSCYLWINNCGTPLNK